MSDKGEVSHTDFTERPPRRRRFVRHCARFWWAYLLVFICIVVLVVCLIIFVAVPKIAQQKIDDAVLSIQSIVMSQTTADSYTLSINSTISTDGSVHATIDKFNGSMYLEDYPTHEIIATVEFPETTSDREVNVSISQPMQITDVGALTRFNTWILVNESLRVTVVGETNVHVSGLSRAYGVTFKKTVTIPGLRNFEGTNVTQGRISLVPDAKTGEDFYGFASIPNYSIVTFEIGNITFHNYLLGAEVGTVTLDNVILRPGFGNTNNFTMHASVNQSSALAAMGQRPYCQTGIVPFQLRGKTAVNYGQPLSYFADALASSNQTVNIDLGGPLKTAGLPISCPKTS